MQDYLMQQQQAAVQSQMRTLGIQSSYPQNADENHQWAKNEAQPKANTVRGLLNIAHEQLSELEKEIGRLGEQLLPVRELVPTKESDGIGSALGEPEVIGMLRALISRLVAQQSIVSAISNETRI